MARTTENGHGLTDLQVVFCHEYARSLNATAAYKKAGYKFKNDGVARSSASQLLAKPSIRAYLGEIVNLSSASVVSEITAIAHSRLTDVCDWDGERVTLKSSEALSDKAKAAIKSIKSKPHFSADGQFCEWEVEVVLHDKLSALEKLMKKLSLYPKDTSVIDAAMLLASKDLLLPGQAEAITNGIRGMEENIKQLPGASSKIAAPTVDREALIEALGIPAAEVSTELAKG